LDREKYLEGNDADDNSSDQSATESLFSDASSIPPPNREEYADSNSVPQLEQEFRDTVCQVKINVTGAMLDIVNTSIYARMQFPILDSVETTKHHDSPETSASKSQRVEVLPAKNASSRLQSVMPNPSSLSKKQEKHRRRRAKSKAKKRQRRVSGLFPGK